jgi:hypothetical protein
VYLLADYGLGSFDDLLKRSSVRSVRHEDLLWEAKYRRVKTPKAYIVDGLVSKFYNPITPDAHKEYIYACLWPCAHNNSGYIPVGVKSILQLILYAQEMLSPPVRERLFGGKTPWENSRGICINEFDGVTLQILIRYSAMFRLLEVADTPPWYSFSEGLVYSLMATDLCPPPCDTNLPYPAVIVEYPSGLFAADTPKGLAHMRCAIIMKESCMRCTPELSEGLIAICLFVPESGNILDCPCPIFTYNMELGGEEFEDNLDQNAHMTAESGIVFCPSRGIIGDYEVSSEELCRVLYEVLWSSVLYLGSQQADIQRVPDAPRPRKRKRKRGGVPTAPERDWLRGEEFLVGSTIHVNPLIKRAAIYGEGQGGSSTAPAHAVCGHFKMQPCGTGGRERKRIWVSPYVRNQDNSEYVIGHTYKLA